MSDGGITLKSIYDWSGANVVTDEQIHAAALATPSH
jgi:hypothetical protein